MHTAVFWKNSTDSRDILASKIIIKTFVFFSFTDILDGLKPSSPKPGHIERFRNPDEQHGTSTAKEDAIITQRFLKINVRHITDGQGVVGGVLLVTPNAVMFDPNVSGKCITSSVR